MARYLDGFVLPVPKKNLAAYRRLARKAARVWREYGALEYREFAGMDPKAMPFDVKRMVYGGFEVPVEA